MPLESTNNTVTEHSNGASGDCTCRQQEFMSFEDFKHAMDEWAIADGFTSF